MLESVLVKCLADIRLSMEVAAPPIDGTARRVWELILLLSQEVLENPAGAVTYVLLVILPIVILLIAVVSRAFGRRRYIIKTIENPAGLPGVGNIIRTRIFDELREARKEARTLTRLDGADATLPMPLLAFGEKYKWLEPIVDKIIRKSHFVISVEALPPEHEHVAIHVQLSLASGRQLESQRFEQMTPTVPSDCSLVAASNGDEKTRNDDEKTRVYSALALNAGAWLAFMLSRYSQSKYTVYSHRSVSMFETSSWESYAMLRQGIHRARGEDDKRAWLDAALFEDHSNVGALIEISRMDSEETDSLNALKHGIDHMNLAQSFLEKESSEGINRFFGAYAGTRANPIWYQTAYTLTVSHLNRYYAMKGSYQYDSEAKKHLASALRTGNLLSQAVGATWRTIEHPWKRHAIKWQRRRDLKDILSRESIDLVTLVAGPQAAYETEVLSAEETADIKSRPVEEHWSHAIAHNDMKAIWILLSQLDAEIHLDGPLPETQPSARTLVKVHGCSTCERLFTSSVAKIALKCLPWRVRYNRACVLVQLEEYDDAAAELVQIFDHVSTAPTVSKRQTSGPELLDWARKDPVLKPFRDYVNSHYVENGKDVNEHFGILKALLIPLLGEVCNCDSCNP